MLRSPHSSVQFWFKQVCVSLCFLGANIFLTSSGLIKLGDFGCSVKLKNNTQTMPGEVNSTLGTAGKKLVLGRYLSGYHKKKYLCQKSGVKPCVSGKRDFTLANFLLYIQKPEQSGNDRM